MSNILASAKIRHLSAQSRSNLHEWLNRLTKIRCWREYRWAIIPFLIILTFLADNHYYYSITWLGQDQPAHTNNVLTIIKTGAMPTPVPTGQTCERVGTCEGFQPEWFYDLIAVVTRQVTAVTNDTLDVAEDTAARLVLFVLSIIWFLLVLCAVQLIMPRRAWLAKIAIATAAMLIPQVIMTNTMETNDSPEMVASLAAILVLYLIMRTNRKQSLIWWLIAAVLVSICLALKLSGIQSLAVYAGVVTLIGLGYIIKRQPSKLGRLLLYAGMGIPLMALSFVSTIQRAQYFLGPKIVDAHNVPYDFSWDGNLIPYLTTFSDSIFTYPMWGLTPGLGREVTAPGNTSFWSVQYDELFADTFDLWFSGTEYYLPPDKLVTNVLDGSLRFGGRTLAKVRLAKIILTLKLTVPIGLLMAIGFLTGSIRFLIHPRRVMREGTPVIMLAALATFGSFLIAVIQYHNRDWFTRPRYALATYVLLFVVGSAWITRLWPKHRGLVFPIMKIALWASVLAFCVASYQLFWFSPV